MNPRCSDCAIDMELGTLLDFTYGAVMIPKWHAGLPAEGKFLGRKTGSVKPDSAKLVPTVSYRCPQCGLLCQYANAPPAESGETP